MGNLRYIELKFQGQVYTEQWKIDELLIKHKFNWMVNAEIENARLEIDKDTLIWNAGIWTNGSWYFGVWRDGLWKYGTWQNGVWYNGTWQNGTFKSGIIYDGKFEHGKIEKGEIRGGTFTNTEISPDVIEYTGDEYQQKKQDELQPTPPTTVAQSIQPVGQVRVNGTKPAYQQQAQNTAQPKIQQEKYSMKKLKTFEGFIDSDYCMELRKKRHAAQYLNRKFITKIIETNNKETIKSAIDYIYSKTITMYEPAQFLFSHIYKIDNNMMKNMIISDEKLDFSELDESINISNDIQREIEKNCKTKK
jgi:hypothetical protein